MLHKFIRKSLRKAANVFYRPYVLWRINRPNVVSLFDFRFEIRPGVFHPVYFHSTKILMREIMKMTLAGKRVLDMGTSYGAIAVGAALKGAHVTAADVNSAAVELTKKNAALNCASITVVQSNLFADLDDCEFDLIIFNMPFYPTTAADYEEIAFKAGDSYKVIRDFAGQSIHHLGNRGLVVVIFSEDCGYGTLTKIFYDAGLRLHSESRHSAMFEDFFVVSYVVDRRQREFDIRRWEPGTHN